MENLFELTATELRELVSSGDLSIKTMTQAYSDRISTYDSEFNSFLRFDTDACLSQADQLDGRSKSEPLGALSGLPIAIKDVICIKDRITSCGSRMLEKFLPPYDATTTQRIRAADGLILGQTNMDEFAMGSSNENSAFGPVRNPWNTQHVPGGSSGGAAACVAARLTPLSIGTDTGGSVRQPAAFCGVTGFKPTYGRISRYGLVAFASSLDQIGILAQTAEDISLLLSEISGHDEKDSTSLPEPGVKQVDCPADLTGLKIGIPQEYLGDGLDPEIAQNVTQMREQMESLGGKVETCSLPMTSYGVATYYLIASCEASGNLARYDGAHYGYRTDEIPEQAEDRLLEMYRNTRSEGFGREVKRRIMLGTYALSSGYYDAYYLQALKSRRLIQDELKQAFQKYDLILGPTTPTTAYRLDEKTTDPLAMYLGDIYTVVANLAGIPAISFPGGRSSTGMPIGLQLQGPAGSDRRLLETVACIQSHTQHHQESPKLESTGGAK